MEDFATLFVGYIDSTMIVASLALMVIGYGLKQTPNVPDWSILWILIAIGVCFGVMMMGFNANGVFQGVLIAAVAVLGHQAYKQTKVKRNSDNNEE